jgi:hypothetical protein
MSVAALPQGSFPDRYLRHGISLMALFASQHRMRSSVSLTKIMGTA